EAGFDSPSIEPTRIYRAEDARAMLAGAAMSSDAAGEIDGKFMAAFVRARKPVPCCGPVCCG
ncbi:MAG TPA: arsenite S-adenosylmethyltransferase, partial [Gemmatimonadales bacterium]|nr:arsenite S-adenosylmethyltransferase [Gemmatimonadales bacterium]